jgi:transcriptional regulator with XRE-family HTH domain
MAKKFITPLLVGVFLLPVFALVMRVERVTGVPFVAVMGMASAWGAWICHTERSRKVAELFRRILEQHGISMKAAAHDMGQPASALSEAVNGSEQLSMSRMASLHDDILADFGAGLVELFGHGKYHVIDKPVAELLQAVERQSELLETLVGNKRMASMTLDRASNREVA